MGMLLHRHDAAADKSKTTKLADIAPAEKKTEKAEKKASKSEK